MRTTAFFSSAWTTRVRARLTKTARVFALPLFVLMVFAPAFAQETPPPRLMEKVAEIPYAPGNIAFDYQNNFVLSLHPFFAPHARVMKYDRATGALTPFPDAAWNTRGNNPEAYLDSVLGVRNDEAGVVWMLDMGLVSGITPKLVGWNTRLNSLEKIYPVPAPASIPTSQLNDFVIDPVNAVFVIADEDIGRGGTGAKAALVIVDMKSGAARRVLEGHSSTVPEPIPITADGTTLFVPGTKTPILVGADGIALDKESRYLYYAPLNGRSVYRIKMTDLLDRSLSAAALGERVERYSDKENNGGISIDEAGNLYLSYVESKSIGVVPAQNKTAYRYAAHPQMLWPDGVSFGNDGALYSGAAQLYLGAAFNGGVDKTSAPFYIFKVQPIAPGLPGR